MKRKKGFTLVEMVIVIAVVTILSLISVPVYNGYVLNAKAAEGYALMGAIRDAQKLYYSDYEYFYKRPKDGKTSYDETLGVDARGNQYFTYFCPGANANDYGVTSTVYSKACGTITHIQSITSNSTEVWNY